MQFDIGIALAQRRPFASRLLHAIFAEHALSGFQQRNHVLARKSLGDADEGDAGGIAPAIARRAVDGVPGRV